MHSRYTDADAARAIADFRAKIPAHLSPELLALRTYTARLLGADTSLVVHGGGNTSVKAHAQTLFPGAPPIDVLHVKGSGWDLATIEPAGHPAVRLALLLAYRALADLTDEDMVNELRGNLLDASAPTPSVETLLHAYLPHRFIDHTHADAILALADQPDGARVCRDVFGAELVWVPYVMPGFILAKRTAEAYEAAVAEGRSPTVIILERHGIFTFGETAKESYERMIGAVSRAEAAIVDRSHTVNQRIDPPDPVRPKSAPASPSLPSAASSPASRTTIPSAAPSSSSAPAITSAPSSPARTSATSFKSVARPRTMSSARSRPRSRSGTSPSAIRSPSAPSSSAK
jgi:rhamnose utilization protein RhaD (predicted bifunctional aldolase and dehydrogenase)